MNIAFWHKAEPKKSRPQLRIGHDASWVGNAPDTYIVIRNEQYPEGFLAWSYDPAIQEDAATALQNLLGILENSGFTKEFD